MPSPHQQGVQVRSFLFKRSGDRKRNLKRRGNSWLIKTNEPGLQMVLYKRFFSPPSPDETEVKWLEIGQLMVCLVRQCYYYFLLGDINPVLWAECSSAAYLHLHSD